jgi:predicted nucleic acid-binding protein
VSVFLDTDVLVECLRGSASARAWLADAATETFQIPGIVAMELFAGCRDRADLRNTQRFLSAFDVAWPEASEFAQACDLLVAHRLRGGLGIPDCLIAAMALARSTRLYTFNLRHFRVIPGIDAQEPYPRS